MASDFHVRAITRAPDVAEIQRAQEVRAESGQHSLRTGLLDESERSLREVRPSPKTHDLKTQRDGPHKRGAASQDSQEGESRGKKRGRKDEKGTILDVLC